MKSFKINIADPNTKKCYKTEVKDAQAAPFIGLNIGEKIDGNKIGFDGYEFLVTGGTDYCGFPMRRGILGIRKKITIYKGLGFRGGLKGIKRRKTVCGHKISEKISAINLKVLKEGAKKLSDMFGSKKEAGEAKPEVKGEPQKPKQEKKAEQPVQEKPEEKAEAKEAEKEEKKEKK
ncbi:30S ribosomal protein S6e [Candidatus Woesearchaeota archaeon]|nr:30S ribosomal protein S6e [Candidatus Woesearchaeota archaeon]